MHRLSWIFAALIAVVVIGCGGGPSTPDFGGGDDVNYPDNGTNDGQDDIEEDAPPDVQPDLNPGDTKETIEDVGPVPCQKNSDCVDAAIELGQCQKKVCGEAKFCVAGWDSACCMETVYFHETFETDLSGWTVNDPKPNDFVGWQIAANRRAFGSQSAYFGNPTCLTYYSGALDANCDPVDPEQKDSAPVRASMTSGKFFLPPISSADTTFIASAYIWVESEPMIGGIAKEVQPDQFRMSIVTMNGESEVTDQVVSSTLVEKNSNGVFVYISGNVSNAVGKEAALRLSFDSIDGSNNLFEGVYVDEVKVFSICSQQCDSGTTCEADEEACTDDKCQVFGNREQKGACTHPIMPACVEPVCTPQNVATKCPNSDPCVSVSCPAGACIYTDLPEDECCRQFELLSTGFEDGTAGGFELWAYMDNQTVKWQPSSFKSATGSWALYYGNTVTRTYESGLVMNNGEASSQELELRAGYKAFLSFDLFLSTEWDQVTPANYYNPAQWDLFTVQVVERMGQPTETVTDVWSSHNVHGTTGGVFIPVGVDLSPWAGKVVRVRFRFETGNEEFNNFEGVYIDNVKVIDDKCKKRECKAASDCGVDGVCRVGGCVDEVCDVQLVGATGCCAVQQDCNDSDDCTSDGCVANQCLHEFIEKPGCCFPDVRADYTFDIFGDLDGFAVVNDSVPGTGGADVRWHLSDRRFHAGTRSMYFGNGDNANYDNGGIARGKATSPEFRVPATGDYELSFSVFVDVQTDSAKDKFVVDVMDGLTPTTVFSKAAIPSAVYRNWFEVTGINLNTFKGKNIRLRFSFDSVDSLENAGEGVFVDSIRVVRACD